MNFASGLSGLGAAYPGYVSGRNDLALMDINEAKAQDIQTQLLGRQAYGRALQSMFGGQPQPPMPGQQSMPPMPQQPGSMPPSQGMPGGAPAMPPPAPPGAPPGPQPLTPPSAMPVGIPNQPPMQNAATFDQRYAGSPGGPGGPGGPAAPAGAPPMSPPGQGGGMPGPSPQGMGGPGSLDWRVIIQSVARSNPGAPPQVIAAAVDQFTPMMNQESKLQWQEMKANLQMQMAQQKLETAVQIAQMRDQGADRRAGIGPNSQGGSGLSKEAIDAAAERYLQSGQLPPNLGRGVQGRADMGAIHNRAAEIAREKGVNAEDLPKNWQKFKAAQVAIQRFESGPQGNTARALNVAIDHIATIDELAKALKNGNMQLFNRISQTIAEQTGKPAPTNIESAKAIIGPEIIKAIGVAGAGTKEERQHAADAWNRARSPAQLAEASATIKKLLAGQLRGLRQQYIKSTGLPQKDFDEMMLPETLRQLEGLGHGSTSTAPEFDRAAAKKAGYTDAEIDAFLKKK